MKSQGGEKRVSLMKECEWLDDVTVGGGGGGGDDGGQFTCHLIVQVHSRDSRQVE